MQKTLTIASFIVSASPFAFWKMDGPFGVEEVMGGKVIDEKTNKLLNPVIRLNLSGESYMSTIDGLNPVYIFVYNSQLGYSIGSIANVQYTVNTKCVDFFQGNNDLSSLELVGRTPNFYFFKEQPQLNVEGSRDLIGWVKIFKEVRFKFDKSVSSAKPVDYFKYTQPLKYANLKDVKFLESNVDSKHVYSFKAQESIATELGVLIKTQDNKVSISKGGDPIDFQKALAKFYSQDNQNIDLSTAMVQSHFKDSKDRAVYDLDRAANRISNVTQNEINRLNSSTIIAVYAVIKGDKGKDSLIWGLAEDNDTKEKFHWMTDLENNDVSVLVNQ